MQRILIIGAGAMGGLIGGLLHKAGHNVTLLARGEHAASMRRNGLSLSCSNGEKTHIAVNIADDIRTAGQFDQVWITTKANQLQSIAPHIPNLLADENSTVIPAINGIPWWYFQRYNGPLAGITLTSIDPEGILARHIKPEQIIGCVNYLGGAITAPGEISYIPIFRPSLVLGELDGAMSTRLQNLTDALETSGLMPKATDDIRYTIWHKLWGNAAFNPIGALANASMGELATSATINSPIYCAMKETENVAKSLGITFNQTFEERISIAAKLISHRTSMEQDIINGKTPETEAIIGSVCEIGEQAGIATPYLNMLYALVDLKSRTRMPAEKQKAMPAEPHKNPQAA